MGEFPLPVPTTIILVQALMTSRNIPQAAPSHNSPPPTPDQSSLSTGWILALSCPQTFTGSSLSTRWDTILLGLAFKILWTQASQCLFNLYLLLSSSRKTSISALLTMPKPSTVWITINCGKFWKRWEYQTTWPASRETCMQVRKQQLELDMEQQTGSK